MRQPLYACRRTGPQRDRRKRQNRNCGCSMPRAGDFGHKGSAHRFARGRRWLTEAWGWRRNAPALQWCVPASAPARVSHNEMQDAAELEIPVRYGSQNVRPATKSLSVEGLLWYTVSATHDGRRGMIRYERLRRPPGKEGPRRATCAGRRAPAAARLIPGILQFQIESKKQARQRPGLLPPEDNGMRSASATTNQVEWRSIL